jgi:hypothetical protein
MGLMSDFLFLMALKSDGRVNKKVIIDLYTESLNY